MTDPIITLSVNTIVSLAFQEFIKSGSGELAKKFTSEAIAKMGQLRELIWNRVMGKYPEADVALEKAMAGEQDGIDIVATLLGVEMLNREFAGQVKAIAQEIDAGKLSDQPIMNQNNFGNSSNIQATIHGTAYIGNKYINDQKKGVE
jgi:hypothetical protein